MAHVHDDVHDTREVDIIDRGGSGVGAGVMLAIAALLVVAIIGLGVLWARPWDDNGPNTNPNVPGISDNNGGGNNAPSGGDNSGGGTGGSQPAPAQ